MKQSTGELDKGRKKGCHTSEFDINRGKMRYSSGEMVINPPFAVSFQPTVAFLANLQLEKLMARELNGELTLSDDLGVSSPALRVSILRLVYTHGAMLLACSAEP